MNSEYSILVLLLSFFISRLLSHFAVKDLNEDQKKLLFNAYSKDWKLVILVVIIILSALWLLQNSQIIGQEILFPLAAILATLLAITFGWLSYKRIKPLNFPNNSAIKYVFARSFVFIGFAFVGIFGFQSM